MTTRAAAPPDAGGAAAARAAVLAARREAAAAAARLAEAAVQFADARVQEESDRSPDSAPPSGAKRPRPGEFVADELSLLLRDQPFFTRRLVCRTRRLRTGLPTVWEACLRGEVDQEHARVIDRVARRVTEASTLAAIDAAAVDAAQSRTPKQLRTWLLRLVVRLEPHAFAERHRRALTERRVTVVQGADGMGYVTGEVSATDAAAIDAVLTTAARDLGTSDPRTAQQRRADLFADLLLGRLQLIEDEPDDVNGGVGGETASDASALADGWLEVEDVDPDTGEFLGSRWVRVDGEGEPVEGPADGGSSSTSATAPMPAWVARLARRRQRTPLRIGVVVPLSSLLAVDDCPAELSDRSGVVPVEILRQQIAETTSQAPTTGATEILFTRLLTDADGRLMDVTELGRTASRRLAQAVAIRAGTCRFPSCSVPADACDVDHHEPVPRGPTSASNLDPLCRRHHRAKTFAWQASVRQDDAVEWTMPDGHRYRCLDDPLPVGAG